MFQFYDDKFEELRKKEKEMEEKSNNSWLLTLEFYAKDFNLPEHYNPGCSQYFDDWDDLVAELSGINWKNIKFVNIEYDDGDNDDTN